MFITFFHESHRTHMSGIAMAHDFSFFSFTADGRNLDRRDWRKVSCASKIIPRPEMWVLNYINADLYSRSTHPFIRATHLLERPTVIFYLAYSSSDVKWKLPLVHYRCKDAYLMLGPFRFFLIIKLFLAQFEYEFHEGDF